MVLGGHGQVGPAHGATGQAQPVEGLGGGDLVHEVQVDVEQVALVFGPVDHVAVPHLVTQRSGFHGFSDGVGSGRLTNRSRTCMSQIMRSSSHLMETISGVGVLDKAVRLLALLEDAPLPLSRLTAQSGYSRATTHRLLSALEVHGMVRRDDRGQFALGPRLVVLGRAAQESVPWVAAAGPALAALRDQTGESVQLYVRAGDRRVCVASLESPHGLRTIVPLGAVLPLEVGSAGAVLRDDPSVRKNGWAASVAEREPGVASVSAPVHDANGRGGGCGERVGSPRAHYTLPRSPLRPFGVGRRPLRRSGSRVSPLGSHGGERDDGCPTPDR